MSQRRRMSSSMRASLTRGKKNIKEENGIFAIGDIVWIKVCSLYWPGTVTKVLKKCKKAVVKLFEWNRKKNTYTKSFKDLIDFRNSQRNRKLLSIGKEENCKVEEAFLKAKDVFEKRNYAFKNRTLEVIDLTADTEDDTTYNTGENRKMDKASSSRMSNTDKDDDDDDDVKRIEKLMESFGEYASDTEEEDDKTDECKQEEDDSPDGQKVIEEVKKPACLRYLKSVFQGRSPSPRHNVFMRGSLCQRKYLKWWSGVGPLDVKQVTVVYNILLGYLPKIVRKGSIDNPSSYLFDVLLPEAIIFALENIHGITKGEAEEVFMKTTRRKWSVEKCSDDSDAE